MSATFAARSVHTGERASSPSHPIGRCSEALVSGIEGQPSATRLRGQRPATYCGRRMPPAAALSRRARRGGDSIRPGPARQTYSRSPAALTQLVSAQIVPGIDVLALSAPTTAGCLQLARLRLRIRGGAHPRRAAHPGGAASCSSPALRSQQSAMRFQAHGICCGWRTAIDSSTVSAGSARRRLDLTGRGKVDPLAVSAYGLDQAVCAIGSSASPDQQGLVSACVQACTPLFLPNGAVGGDPSPGGDGPKAVGTAPRWQGAGARWLASVEAVGTSRLRNIHVGSGGCG